MFIAEAGGIVLDWIAFRMATPGPRPVLAYDSAYLQVLSVLASQPGAEKRTRLPWEVFMGQAQTRISVLPTGQNSVMWPHLCAREAKKCSCLPRGKGNEFGQIHASFCHCEQVEDMGFEPRQSGFRDLLFFSFSN